MQLKTKPVKIGSVTIGQGDLVVMAGPCSLESESHFLDVASYVKSKGAQVLRGGIFKMRTDPTSFQGMGENAYEVAKKVRSTTHMPFISEITDARQIGDMIDVVDAFQVGSRNMYNYSLLKELGQQPKPVMIKRGLSAMIKEWILAAEYVVKGGNENVILCERGIRTFETATRNTFDINAIAYIKQNTPFPIVADPSHGTGVASMVTPVALAAAAAGADAVMVEVHPRPTEALSDGFQALDYKAFDQLMAGLQKMPRNFL